ncbi:MAG: hypothetical protein LBH00_10070 [Planctomycetaceae bacterium]|jgi:hypothetical protein|nr:hypothetical protein [Planctomycetaceae bacterium]
MPESKYQKIEKQRTQIRPHRRKPQDQEWKCAEQTTDRRRALGQFYTPPDIAKTAWQLILKQLGENFWQDGTWRIWDNCAGSGNLEYNIVPPDALPYTYLSTINADEAEFLKTNSYFKGRTRAVFPFDWLNDHHSKLPEVLKADLANGKIKWLFFINPPYKEAAGYTAAQKFSGAGSSTIAEEMKSQKMGKCAGELTMQFLYKIERDFGKHGYYLGLFSKAKWMTKPSAETFREMWIPQFDGGFMLNANEHFTQPQNEKHELKTRGTFPIIFSLLNHLQKTKNWKQDWTYHVLDRESKITGHKTFLIFDKKRLAFREYFFPVHKENKVRPVPVVSGAVIPLAGKKAGADQVSEDFIGTMVFYQADFQHHHFCNIVSGLAHSGYPVTTGNYISILTGFGLFKSVKYDWTRDADLFYAPYRDLTETEIADCVLYALICGANNTATTRINGLMLLNWFNPFHKTKFDWTHLSPTGRYAFDELTHYCRKIVQWENLHTPYGSGVWLGLYQYRTACKTVNKTYRKKFGVDYPNQDLYGIPYPDSFRDAAEKLREKTETLAVDLCLTADKEVIRTRDTFRETFLEPVKKR